MAVPTMVALILEGTASKNDSQRNVSSGSLALIRYSRDIDTDSLAALRTSCQLKYISKPKGTHRFGRHYLATSGFRHFPVQLTPLFQCEPQYLKRPRDTRAPDRVIVIRLIWELDPAVRRWLTILG